MRRQSELVTAILQWLEGRDVAWSDLPKPGDVLADPRVDQAVIDYHVDLCEQAGFVRVAGRDTTACRVQLTWMGHEQLETRRAIGAILGSPKTSHAA